MPVIIRTAPWKNAKPGTSTEAIPQDRPRFCLLSKDKPDSGPLATIRGACPLPYPLPKRHLPEPVVLVAVDGKEA